MMGLTIMKRQRQSRKAPHFVPPDATIAELEKKASECEQKAAKEEEPLATQLRNEAKRYRGWIAALRLRRWTS